MSRLSKIKRGSFFVCSIFFIAVVIAIINVSALEKNNENEIKISFSSKYMLDCIKSFETENVTLYMNNDNSPIIIKSNEDESLIQLIFYCNIKNTYHVIF